MILSLAWLVMLPLAFSLVYLGIELAVGLSMYRQTEAGHDPGSGAQRKRGDNPDRQRAKGDSADGRDIGHC